MNKNDKINKSEQFLVLLKNNSLMLKFNYNIFKGREQYPKENICGFAALFIKIKQQA